MGKFVQLVNATQGDLMIGVVCGVNLGTVKEGGTLTLPEELVNTSEISGCVERGWLQNPGTASARPRMDVVGNTVAARGTEGGFNNEGTISFFPEGNEFPDRPPQFQPRTQPNQNQFGFSEDEMSAMGAVNADMAISGNRNNSDEIDDVQSADNVVRRAMRANIPGINREASDPDLAVNASRVNSRTPVNMMTGQPTHARIPGQNATGRLQRPNITGQTSKTPPFMQGQATDEPAGEVQVQQPGPGDNGGQIIVKRGPGRPPRVGNLINAPKPIVPARSNKMGQLIIGSEVPGGAELFDLEDLEPSARRGLEAMTNSIVKEATQGNRVSLILNKYRTWTEPKKQFFIQRCMDADLLNKMLPVERSGSVALQIRNRIAALTGQAVQQNQAAQLDATSKVLLEYPDWSDDHRKRFVISLNDPTLLQRLAKREPSPTVMVEIQNRLFELQKPAGGLDGAVEDAQIGDGSDGGDGGDAGEPQEGQPVDEPAQGGAQ